jgi:hypothetical protein
VDASFMIEANSTLSIITDKDEAGLEVIRHSSAHLLAPRVALAKPEPIDLATSKTLMAWSKDFSLPSGRVIIGMNKL